MKFTFRPEDPPQPREQYLAQLKASQFNAVILFSLHVHSAGELYYGDSMRNAVTKLALLLHQFSVGVSFCPYTSMTDWFACLADTYEKNAHQQIVKRLNLQCYDGGGGNTTRYWLDSLKSYPGDLGIPDIDSFIVPGYWVCSARRRDGTCLSQYSPDDICKVFSNPDLRQNAAGAFLWNSSDIFKSGNSFEDYSRAVANGLAGKC